MSGSKCSSLGTLSDAVTLWNSGNADWAWAGTIPSPGQSRIATTANLEIRIGDLLSWKNGKCGPRDRSSESIRPETLCNILNYRASARLGVGSQVRTTNYC